MTVTLGVSWVSREKQFRCEPLHPSVVVFVSLLPARLYNSNETRGRVAS